MYITSNVKSQPDVSSSVFQQNTRQFIHVMLNTRRNDLHIIANQTQEAHAQNVILMIAYWSDAQVTADN